MEWDLGESNRILFSGVMMIRIPVLLPFCESFHGQGKGMMVVVDLKGKIEWSCCGVSTCIVLIW